MHQKCVLKFYQNCMLYEEDTHDRFVIFCFSKTSSILKALMLNISSSRKVNDKDLLLTTSHSDLTPVKTIGRNSKLTQFQLDIIEIIFHVQL